MYEAIESTMRWWTIIRIQVILTKCNTKQVSHSSCHPSQSRSPEEVFFGGFGIPENRNLCVISCLRCYEERIKEFRSMTRGGLTSNPISQWLPRGSRTGSRTFWGDMNTPPGEQQQLHPTGRESGCRTSCRWQIGWLNQRSTISTAGQIDYNWGPEVKDFMVGI